MRGAYRRSKQERARSGMMEHKRLRKGRKTEGEIGDTDAEAGPVPKKAVAIHGHLQVADPFPPLRREQTRLDAPRRKT
jgi:hypothetical protein